MEDFQAVLLSVWREACRHIEITQSTANIAAMLVEWMPLEQVLVRRLDLRRSSLETVAVGLGPAGAGLPHVRTVCSAEQLDCLLTWRAKGEIIRISPGAANAAQWAFLLPSGFQGDILVGPLGSPKAPSGVLALCRPAAVVRCGTYGIGRTPVGAVFDSSGKRPPFKRDGRIAEAAEADKRSLLTKLGRKELGDTIVGADAGLRAVMERVELVAPSDAPVLIFGETGTGKELIAR